jgi:CBS domain-containing protein
LESPRIKVKDVMTKVTDRDLVKVTVDSTVDDAWKMIESTNKKKIVVVGENDYPLKMLTISDIAGQRREQKIGEMIDKLDNVAIAEPNADIDNIRDELAEGKLAVAVENSKPVGVVTAGDIARYWQKLT